MSMWDKPLTHDNIDEFFRLFAPPAYRSTYRILGDTTRTENALTEAFLEVYHRRNSDDVDDLVFLFSDILQKRVETLASHYPIAETTRNANRVLDEFTENSILSEIHHRIDSMPYKILEIFTASSGTAGVRTDPILGQIRKSGISLFLILQLILVSILIFAITYTCATSVFGINDLAPQSPDKSELSIKDLLGPTLNFLPMTITGQTAAADEMPTESITTAAESITGQPDTSSVTTPVNETTEPAVASATRG